MVSKSDITFAMLSDPAAALSVATGYSEIAAVNGICAGKGYIDCSTVSVDCSQRIASAVTAPHSARISSCPFLRTEISAA